MGDEEARTALVLGIVALLGVSAPVFALTVSIVAFAVAVFALHRVNDLVKQIDASAANQAKEIIELADPHGEVGDGSG